MFSIGYQRAAAGACFPMAGLAYSGVVGWALVSSPSAYLALGFAAAPALAIFFASGSAWPLASKRKEQLAWFVLLGAALPWLDAKSTTDIGSLTFTSRTNQIKVALTLGAIILAYFVRQPGARWRISLTLLLAYAGSAAVGGGASGSSILRTLHYAGYVFAIAWLSQGRTTADITRMLARFSVVICGSSLAAYAAGLTSLQDGRLYGYIPNIAPSQLGLLAGLGIVSFCVLFALHEPPDRLLSWSVPLLGIALILSGSRISILAVIISISVMGLRAARQRAHTVLLALFFPILVAGFVQTYTSYRPIGDLATRSGTTTLLESFNVRSSAAAAVTRENASSFSKAFGHGLNAKSVRVNLPYSQYASVDITWIASYLSGGIIGILLLGSAVLSLLVSVLRSGDLFATAIIVFLIVHSSFGGVFNDVTVGLIPFVGIAATAWTAQPNRATRRLPS